ncbi:MAG: 50S ribosomal protein L35 [Clostridia bacterium]|nr:50S ribosomal protein L35 [Clostridia bacterium]
MPKMKTHTGAKKRFSFTKGGKVKINHSLKNHFLAHKTTKRKRNLRKRGYADATNEAAVKRLMPYA